MKVLLINGSPHKQGCTYTALSEVANSLEAAQVKTEIIWIGIDPIRGCTACGKCSRNGENRCVFDDDIVNTLIEKTQEANGLVVGSPVHYAGAGGAILSTLDRMFYAAGSTFQTKPGAGIASARRAGTTLAIDQLNKYFQISQMPVVTSTYWPMVHGSGAEDVLKDEEGLHTMRVLGTNMAWLLRCIEAGPAFPKTEPKIMTNFIR